MWSSRGQLSDWAFLFHHWKPETKVTHSSVVYLDYSHAGHVYILVDHEHHVMVWFLLLTIAGNVYEISAILSLDDETYDTFLDLLEGKFNVPWKQRNNKQNSALVRFWRNRDHVFSEMGQGMLRWEARIQNISCSAAHCSESIQGNKRIRCEETLSPFERCL